MFIETASPAVYFGVSGLRERFPGISWGEDPPDWALATVGAARVVEVAAPEPGANQEVIPAAATFSGGVWTRAWSVVTKSNARIVADKIAAINTRKAELLARGAPYGEKYINVMDQNALAVIGGVTSAAILANAGALSWGSPYNTHIAQDNSQVTFATAADGIAFARSVGGWYGAVVLHARSLKDAVEAAADPTTVDITAGWPA